MEKNAPKREKAQKNAKLQSKKCQKLCKIEMHLKRENIILNLKNRKSIYWVDSTD